MLQSRSDCAPKMDPNYIEIMHNMTFLFFLFSGGQNVKIISLRSLDSGIIRVSVQNRNQNQEHNRQKKINNHVNQKKKKEKKNVQRNRSVVDQNTLYARIKSVLICNTLNIYSILYVYNFFSLCHFLSKNELFHSTFSFLILFCYCT